jgi:hypothetical protein
LKHTAPSAAQARDHRRPTTLPLWTMRTTRRRSLARAADDRGRRGARHPPYGASGRRDLAGRLDADGAQRALRFDPFGDQRGAEGLGEPDDALQRLKLDGLVLQVADEILVDLEFMKSRMSCARPTQARMPSSRQACSGVTVVTGRDCASACRAALHCIARKMASMPNPTRPTERKASSPSTSACTRNDREGSESCLTTF